MSINIEVVGEKTFSGDKSKTLLKNLLDEGFRFYEICDGAGVCANCKVRILKGECTNLTGEEKAQLTEDEIDSGVRLSCMACALSDISLEIL